MSTCRRCQCKTPCVTRTYGPMILSFAVLSFAPAIFLELTSEAVIIVVESEVTILLPAS